MVRISCVAVSVVALASLAACQSRPQKSFSELAAEQSKQWNDRECSYGAFKPRPFPYALITDVALGRSDDPDNFRVRSLFARCVNGGQEQLDVCGEAVHMNSVGYIDRKFFFSGRWNSQAHTFAEYATGVAAAEPCHRVLAMH